MQMSNSIITAPISGIKVAQNSFQHIDYDGQKLPKI